MTTAQNGLKQRKIGVLNESRTSLTRTIFGDAYSAQKRGRICAGEMAERPAPMSLQNGKIRTKRLGSTFIDKVINGPKLSCIALPTCKHRPRAGSADMAVGCCTPEAR